MGSFGILVVRTMLVLSLYLAAFRPTVLAASFYDYFTAYGDSEHVVVASGAAGFGSTNKYLFGSVSTQIKLIPGNSAGTVLAYYMSSNTAAHDEIDFEFLGNTSGQPYSVQTNIYASGVGGREQRVFLWFDPTTSFHTYAFLWNKAQIIFYVDSIPIRVFKNNEDIGVPFPTSQPMSIYSSLWNGDQWATRGGAVKLNWTYAPFITSYQSFQIDACVASTSSNADCPANSKWNQASFQILSNNDRIALESVRQNYMTYDYCSDRKRYSTVPAECARNTV
ncbi:hypothetical protein O6H91_23G065500 [Diphasiastrum complanatum]|uniref:Uncharacterized protein n=1 Tax=Diphasiastrum complanatum TaxID=34168 RepID=A0ACC2ABD9_DIPCM|nr:hypothetical protein O6H91_23G065500 [Diphasiastrum complanatum]